MKGEKYRHILRPAPESNCFLLPSRSGVGERVRFAREVDDVELPEACALFQAEKAGVCDAFERLGPEKCDEGLVVRGDDQVVAALREVARLLQGPCDGESFSFDGGVAGFGAIIESGAR